MEKQPVDVGGLPIDVGEQPIDTKGPPIDVGIMFIDVVGPPVDEGKQVIIGGLLLLEES